MATWADLTGYKQYVVRSDGAKFRDGVRDDNLDTSWLTISPTVSLGPGLYDELMVIPRVATQEEIEAWAQAQAPWYDPSPVIDAGAQNITAEGAGGRIEINEHGIRAHRYSDNRQMLNFDTNTGNLAIAGDLSGSTGSFANGSVLLDERGFVAVDTETGDYSALDAGRLTFYKAGSDDTGWYVRRVKTGVVESGEYEPLGFDSEPSITLMPQDIITYRKDKSEHDQRLEVYTSNVTREGFQAHCELWIAEGANDTFTSTLALSDSDLPKEAVFPFTTLPETSRIRVSGRNFHSVRVPPRVYGTSIINYKISYRKVGSGSWIDLGTFKTSFTDFNNNWLINAHKSGYRNWTHWIAGISPGEYEIKITFVSRAYANNGEAVGTQYVYFQEMECWAAELLETGRVWYMAVEGGQ